MKSLHTVTDLSLKTIAVNKVTNKWRNHNKTTKISELNKSIELYEL